MSSTASALSSAYLRPDNFPTNTLSRRRNGHDGRSSPTTSHMPSIALPGDEQVPPLLAGVGLGSSVGVLEAALGVTSGVETAARSRGTVGVGMAVAVGVLVWVVGDGVDVAAAIVAVIVGTGEAVLVGVKVAVG